MLPSNSSRINMLNRHIIAAALTAITTITTFTVNSSVFALTRPQFLRYFPIGMRNCVKYNKKWYAIQIIDYYPGGEGTVIVRFLEGPYYRQYLYIPLKKWDPNLFKCA